MKKYQKLIFLIITFIVSFVAIYKRPMTVDKISDTPSLDKCVEIAYTSSYHGDTSTFGGPFKHSEAQLEKGSEGFEEMMSLLKNKKFTRSFLPVSYRGGTVITKGSYDMAMSIHFSEGDYLFISKLYNQQMWLSYGDKTYRLSFDADDPWFAELFNIMRKYENNKIITQKAS